MELILPAAVHIFVVMLVVENGVVWVCMIHFELADFLYRHPGEKKKKLMLNVISYFNLNCINHLHSMPESILEYYIQSLATRLDALLILFLSL